MPNNRTITAANSVLYISVAGLYPVPQRIQGFSADDITDTDNVEPTETSMGVDGRLSFGWAAVAVPQNITLQADSLSNDMFETWWAQEQQQREKFVATGLVSLPSIGKKYTFTRGVLRGYMPLPSIKRSLQARRYSLTWERVTPAPY